MNYVKKLNLHWFCTQNHILEPFSVRRACTKSYVTSEPYPRASQIWCQNVRETWKKKVIKCRGESFARSRARVIARNVEGPPSLFRVNKIVTIKIGCSRHCVGAPVSYTKFVWSSIVNRWRFIISSILWKHPNKNLHFRLSNPNCYNEIHI